MLSVPSTTTKLRSALLIVFTSASLLSFAQINSPYSRYGLGDLYPGGHIINKSMGGLTAAYSDIQAINFMNPASYARIGEFPFVRTGQVTFDISTEIESRTLHNLDRSAKYKSSNFNFNYLAVGIPLSKKRKWGMAFGIRPETKQNYKVESRDLYTNTQTLKDSIYTLYEGSGGSYKAFIGTGAKFGGLSVGVNFGYHFGQSEISTRRIFINDTVAFYKSNSANNVSFGGMFGQLGLQYDANIGKAGFLRLGGTYDLKHNLDAKQDIIRETFSYDQTTGAPTSLDSVYKAAGANGTIKYPQSYSVGLFFGSRDTLYKFEKWMIGIQYDAQSWNDYTSYGQKDQVANSYMLRIGGQIRPSLTGTSFFSRLTYRAGFYTGKDPVKINNVQVPVYAITFGAGIPIRNPVYYSQLSTTLNVGFEIGKRGNNTTLISENIFKLHIGFSLSDVWFNKRKYD